VVIIQDGKILRENLVKTQFNLDDLRQELHKYGMDMTNIADIKLARLESCGDFTIVKNPDVEPLTKSQFENALQSIYENPLSRGGSEFVKIHQLAEDVKYLADFLRRQETVDQSESNTSQPQIHELH